MVSGNAYEIEVNSLTKLFNVKTPQKGVKNKIKGFFFPSTKKIHAVNDVSFKIKKGELIGFIGPNGAGKSTTLKMLCGILYPNNGTINVAGFDPQKDRKKLAYKIGTIFGQKPQLWFHLPAIDSFNLFSKIYSLDKKEYEKRRDYLIKTFELEEIINQPVRKLSLGQRMKCEFVLALLHKPEVLFLDEPTIGMDIVAKKTMRELIKKVNHEENVTIILTSHDMDDVEDVCNRMIIINHGKLIYDGEIASMKEKYVKKKFVSIATEKPVKVFGKKGVLIREKKEFSAEIEVDMTKVKLKEFMDEMIRENIIEDITISEPPIEDIIEEIYKKGKVRK